MSDLAPNVENYLLGRGVLYFAQFNDEGIADKGELDLGNCSEFKLNLGTDKLAHYSKRSGLKTKDKEVVQQLNASGAFTIDEYSKENLCIALYGELVKLASTAGNVTGEQIAVQKGRWFKLQHRVVSNVVVTGYVANVDYRVDAITGRIYVIPTGHIEDGEELDIDYSYAQINYNTIQAFKKSSVRGYLRFIGDPGAGPAYEAEIWTCSLATNGDIPWLADDWGSINIDISIDKDQTGHPTNPFFHVIDLEADYGVLGTTTS